MTYRDRAILFVLLLALFFLISSCRSVSQDQVVVRIEVQDPQSVDFKKYDHVFYRMLAIKDMPKSYDPRPLVNDFFLKEFSQIIKRDVELSQLEGAPADSLVISGQLTFDIKDRSIIKKVKGESGKKEKGFVSIQIWVMSLDITLTETGTSKVVFEKSYKSNLKEADPKRPDFNFKSLFNELTDRFIRQVIKRNRLEERTLLVR